MTHELSIGDVAERTGLSVHTLRYYERVGLLDGVDRASSGHRRYTEDDVGWIRLLTCLRSSGMPIRAMRDFAALRRGGNATAAERRALLEDHRQEVLARQEELARYLAVLDSKIAYYRGEEAAPPDGARTAVGAGSAARSRGERR